jgi:hypothetical protein
MNRTRLVALSTTSHMQRETLAADGRGSYHSNFAHEADCVWTEMYVTPLSRGQNSCLYSGGPESKSQSGP